MLVRISLKLHAISLCFGGVVLAAVSISSPWLIGTASNASEFVNSVNTEFLAPSSGPAHQNTEVDPEFLSSGAVSISGRILSSSCRGVRNVQVELAGQGFATRYVTTSTFGFYRFDDVPSPTIYTISVNSRHNNVLPRQIDTSGATTNIDLIEGGGHGPCVFAGVDNSIILPGTAALNGSAASSAVSISTTWSKISGPGEVGFANPADASTVATFSAAGLYILRLSADDGSMTMSDDIQITVEPVDVPPPPDPVMMAPPLSKTVATNILTATKFLYTGPNPIQTGVDPDDIKPVRVGLFRGKVVDKAGTAIPNVSISILDHPELGQTRTRSDGMFDMVVNAGGELTVKYEKANYIASQRTENIDWQTYMTSDDVVMLPYDPNVTEIDLNSTAPIQVASGSMSDDASGQRRPRLLFKQGTTATITLPNHSTQTLTMLHVRSTEFTVGENGREAMPGDLPPTSEYTYASEYSVDEAVGLNAVSTTFNQAVIQYLENFVGFPTGVVVPTGSYNKATGKWEPEENGRVVKILSIDAGMANLDLTGSGTPATDQEYLELGIDVAERQKVAEFYQPNQTLWRVPLSHFSAWDCNYPFADKPPPNAPPPFFPAKPKKPCEDEDGCTEEIQSQTVTETIEIHQTGYQIEMHKEPQQAGAVIPIVGPTPQDDVIEAAAIINIAGRTIKSDILPATANLIVNFEWDGLDDFGRRAQGKQRAFVSIVNFYPLQYAIPGQVGAPQFGQTGNGSGQMVSGTGKSIAIRNYEFELGGFDRPVNDLGGWDFNIHHVYNPVTRTIIEGNGSQRSASTITQSVVTTAGQADSGFDGDGGPATAAKFNSPSDVVFAPDGRYFIADTMNNRIRMVSTDGIVTTFAGNGAECDPTEPCGDGGMALDAQLFQPQGVAVAADGSVLISDTNSNRIRRVDPNGAITTIIGNGVPCQPMDNCGDDGPGSAATLNSPRKIHLAEDGSIFIADSGSNRVKKLSTDGTITTVAGNGMEGCPSDNVPARMACIESPSGVALTSNGALYITADAPAHSQVVRLDTDGKIHQIADGICNGARPEKPEGLRSICNPKGVAIGADGNPYVASSGENRIYKYDTDGIWKDIVGSGSSGLNDEGQPSLLASLNHPASSVFAPNGDLYIAATDDNKIRRAASPLPGFTNSDALIASEDGSEVFEFDGDGRHTRTLNALTGTNKYVFAYNADGNLVSITDGDNNVTTVERNGAGKPTGIRSPYGQLTSFTLDANGYLASVTNPAGESNQYTYNADGFLLSKRDPNGNVNTFTYDDKDRLIRNDNQTGGSHNFSKNGTASDYTVTHKSPLNRTSTFRVQNSVNQDETQTNIFEDESVSRLTNFFDGSSTEIATNGSTAETIVSADPRWGMQAPISLSSNLVTPGGRSLNLGQARSAVLSDSVNPFSLTAQQDTLDVNGRHFTLGYMSSNRTFTLNSPLNRISTYVIDPNERLTQFQMANINPLIYSYDSRGRLSTLGSGTGDEARTFTNTYNAAGFVSQRTDPFDRVTEFDYDAVGRTTQISLSDNRLIGFGYDAVGNLASVTPPGRPAHTFSYNNRNLLSSYTAPNIGGNSTTTYEYNADRDLTRIVRPDGLQINYVYNLRGQLQSMTTPSGSYDYINNAQSGQLSGIISPGSVTNSFQYDGFLVTRSSLAGPVSGDVSYTYNNDLKLSSVAVNGATAIDYTYDDDGLLSGAGGLTLGRSSQNGLLTGSSIGNITDTIAYSTFGETSVYDAKSNAVTVYNTQYTNDKLGRIMRKVETIGGSTTTYDYGYDTSNRLATVTVNNALQPIITYSYDSNDNRTSVNAGGNITGATYDAQDRLTTYGTTAYTYGSNGDLQSKNAAAGTTNYSYDVFDNLRSVTLPNGTQIEYVIDGLNRRVGKRVNGIVTQGFLYQDQLQIAAELDASGNLLGRFVYASRSNTPDLMLKNGQTFRLIYDNVGSVRLVIEISSGSVVQRIDYDEFGVVLQDSNPGFQPFGFAGGLYDTQTRLIRFGARDYDPETGRWTTRETPTFFGNDTNLYSYAFADPINFFDANGRNAAIVAGGAIAGVGTAGLAIGVLEGYRSGDCECGVEKGKKAGLILGALLGGALGSVVGQTPAGAAVGAAVGAVTGAVGGGWGGSVAKLVNGGKQGLQNQTDSIKGSFPKCSLGRLAK
ncbi:MAG: RHS repeat-associated core domain-containing protein [Pyrinomonadaceae bacterium]